MKEKVITATVLTMILMGTLLIITPTFGTPDPIKIGIIGPHGLPHWSPSGMKEASYIAAQEINDAGGINVGGVYRNVTIVEGDEHSYPTYDVGQAQAEIVSMYGQGCRFFIGGFRTEVTGPMIETAMTQAEEVIFLINGAATNALISGTVPVNYEKYKYLFRVNPVNDTMLLMTIVGGLGALIAKMLPLYGCYNPDVNRTQLKYAVISEDNTWTLTMHAIFTTPSLYSTYLGPNVNCTYAGRIGTDPPPGSTVPWLTNVANSGARILIHIFSHPVGALLIGEWAAMQVKAVPVGINVVAQLESHWLSTSGACEYESILNFVGTRTPITPEAVAFWDSFLDYTAGYTSPPYPPPGGPYWPIYTAFGAYNAMYSLKDAIEDATHPTPGTIDMDAVVSALETQERQAINGLSKFTTSPIPHDVYCNSYGPYWPTPRYTRAMLCQWQAAQMEVVCPIYADYPPTTLLPYVKDWAFPPWMYPNQTDVNYDGKVRVDDILEAALAFGSEPGYDRWQRRIDVTNDYKIRVDDILAIALDFGKTFDIYFPLWCDG